MKKTVFSIIIIALFVSFGNCQELSIGTYSTKDKTTQIDFHKDSTFRYKYTHYWDVAYSEGEWKLFGDKIILNSRFSNLNQLPIEVIEAHIQDPLNHLIFEINSTLDDDKKGKRFLKYLLVVNDTDTVYYDSKNIFSINNIGVNSFYITLLYNDSTLAKPAKDNVLRTKTYFVLKSENNSFRIKLPIDWRSFNYVIFSQDWICIKRNKLKWNDKVFYFRK